MRMIGAGLLAALVVTIWGALSWTTLPWHLMTIRTIPDGEAVASALHERVTRPGVYHYPGPSEEAGEGWVERYRRGPNINLLVFSPAGSDPASPVPFAVGFALNWVAAIVAAALLASAALPRFGHRVLFVALLGGFAAVQARLVDWNWWHFGLDYSLVMAADLVIGWALAGLVLAALVRPPVRG